MKNLRKRYFTPDEYLLLENRAEFKSQYVAGEIFAADGEEPEHVQIVGNIVSALHTAFGERPCQVYCSQLRVKVEQGEMYTYPDVVALCGEGQFEQSSEPSMLLNPQVVFEVLSPFTETFDRGEKFVRYRTLASLTDYVLVAPDAMRVEHFTRQPDAPWTMTESLRPVDRVPLRALEVELTLAQIYRRFVFPA